MVGVYIGEGVRVERAGDIMCVVAMCGCTMCVCINGSVVRVGDMCVVAMCGCTMCVCGNGSILRECTMCACVNGSILRVGDVCVVAMCGCTMCVCVNACVGEGTVGAVHAGGVCVAREVYGAIVMCMGAGSTVCVGDVCAGDVHACFVLICICLVSMLITLMNRGISFCARYRYVSLVLSYKS